MSTSKRFLLFHLLFLGIFLPGTLVAQSYSLDITADNLSKEKKEAILKSLNLYKLRTSPYLSADYIERLFEKGVLEIEKSLQVFGYYRATINKKINKDSDPWSILYEVDTGPALKIRNIDVVVSGAGRNDDSIRDWHSSFPFSKGDILDQQVYENAKNKIRQILLDYGFLDGKIPVHELRISLADYYADMVLHIDTGNRYRVGEITFLQNVFEDNYLRGFLPIQSGDYYETDKLTELQKLLSQSGEFKKIEINPQVNQAKDQQIPINIGLEPRKPQRYTIGVGYGTDTGARIRLGAQRRQITRTGHHSDFEIFYSVVRAEYKADYFIPLAKPATDYVNFNATRTIEDADDLYRITNSTSVSAVYGLKEWRRILKLTYLDESFEVGIEDEHSQLLMPSIAFKYVPLTARDLNISQWRINVELKAAEESLYSDTTFTQTRLTMSNRLPLFSQLALVSRADIGASEVNEFKLLPISQRFFAGGDNSIRGFAYQSLGPEDESGDVVGGSHLLVGSLELQYKLDPNWELATFIDAGNAFNKDQFEPEQGAGIGFGYALPLGSLRAYGATALSRSGNPWRLHITVGAQW